MKNNKIFHGDCLQMFKMLPDDSVDVIVTDPPYLLNVTRRNHGNLTKYQTELSPLMREFEQYQLASGRWSENYNLYLTLFDRHCATKFSESVLLTQEMLDSWCGQRKTEVNNSCRSRIYSVVSFVRYLQKRGLTDVSVPVIPRKENRTYIPHAFTTEELQNFFYACDTMVSYSQTEEQISQRLTVPVFFRLLYSSGMRTNEARMLRNNHIIVVCNPYRSYYTKIIIQKTLCTQRRYLCSKGRKRV